MIRARPHHLHSPDVEALVTYAPPNPTHFAFGPLQGEGLESFDFMLCSPGWIYDYVTLERTLRRLCERTYGNTWEEVALKLSRYGNWEYEAYQE